MDLLFLALAAITPVLYMPGSGGFEAVKSAFFIVTASIGMVWLVLHILRTKNPVRTNLLLPIISVVGYILIRTSFVHSPNTAWLGSETSNFGAVHWIVWWLIVGVILALPLTRRTREITGVALGIGLIGMLLVVAAQKTGLEHISWLLYDDPSRGRSLIGSIGSSGQLGLLVSLYILFLLPLRTRIARIHSYLLYPFWILLLAGISVVLASKSLTGISVLVIGLILSIPAVTSRLTPTRTRWIVGLCIALPLIAAVLPIPSALRARVPSFAARIDTWKVAGVSSLHAPIFGYGIEQFPYAFDQYNTHTPANPNILTEENPHSIIMELLSEWGVIGVTLCAWVIVVILRTCRFQRRYIPALIGWLLAAQTNVATVTLFVLLLILCVIALRPRKSSPTTQPSTLALAAALVLTSTLVIISALVASGGIVYAATNDTGVRQSDNHLFMFAAQTYARATAWPFPRSFAYLEYAEALTNNAIKYQSFSDATGYDVLDALRHVQSGSPTARNMIIAHKIMQVWKERTNNPDFATAHQELSGLLKKNWGTAASPYIKSMLR